VCACQHKWRSYEKFNTGEDQRKVFDEETPGFRAIIDRFETINRIWENMDELTEKSDQFGRVTTVADPEAQPSPCCSSAEARTNGVATADARSGRRWKEALESGAGMRW
jgi:hypothetical protein